MESKHELLKLLEDKFTSTAVARNLALGDDPRLLSFLLRDERFKKRFFSSLICLLYTSDAADDCWSV